MAVAEAPAMALACSVTGLPSAAATETDREVSGDATPLKQSTLRIDAEMELSPVCSSPSTPVNLFVKEIPISAASPSSLMHFQSVVRSPSKMGFADAPTATTPRSTMHIQNLGGSPSKMDVTESSTASHIPKRLSQVPTPSKRLSTSSQPGRRLSTSSQPSKRLSTSSQPSKRLSTASTPSTHKPTTAPLLPIASVHAKEILWVTDMDTGEACWLDGSEHCERIVGTASLRTSANLDGSRRGRAAWEKWWKDKRKKDARLAAAAQTGNLQQLQDALVAPKPGRAPVLINSRSRTQDGRTALHFAAAAGNPECVELLLEMQAALEVRTDAGMTALHVSCQHGHGAITSLLLDRNADPLPETKDHSLPLHLASANGHADIVSLLLETQSFGAHRQLMSRSDSGQRPAEASLDLRTAQAFRQYESGHSFISRMSSKSSIGSRTSDDDLAIDHYACRTSYAGAVLLRNARADMVRRALHQMHGFPEFKIMEMLEDVPIDDECSPMKCLRKASDPGTPSLRAPFARIRKDDGPLGPDSFEFVERLGKGSYGEVFQVRHRKTGAAYAMKISKKEQLKSHKDLESSKTERDVLTSMDHPYIVRLYFAFQTKCSLVLVLQFCPGGTLQQLIDRAKKRKLGETLSKLYIAEMLLALIHLHERKIIFRDLKPDNIVLDEAGHGILTDFGLSKENVLDSLGANSFCGSAAYLAPEILRGKGYGKTVDVYGLGVLLFTMMTGRPPYYYPDRKILYENIRLAQLHVPSYVNPGPAELIRSLLEREPSRRLGARKTSHIKKHHFFSDIDFNALLRREVPIPGVTAFSKGQPDTFAGCTRPVGDVSSPLKNPFREKRRKDKESKKRPVHDWSFQAALDAAQMQEDSDTVV